MRQDLKSADQLRAEIQMMRLAFNQSGSKNCRKRRFLAAYAGLGLAAFAIVAIISIQ